MSKVVTILFALILVASSLYTSSFWQKKGFNVRDGIIDQSKTNAIFVQTVCNDVDLSVSPYNYRGVVQSGYLNVGKGGSALGFIFYGKQGASKESLKNYPTIIWLNGGPGSSSQLGNFMQLGPFFVQTGKFVPWEIVPNNYTWIIDYNVLFVDQPVGTGLSYADPNHPSPYVENMQQVANDFYIALDQLYNNNKGCFNQLGITGAHPLFIFGESYAGKYAPAIAQKIKMEQGDRGFLTGLKGVAIGDGFTHPYDILSQVGEFAFNLGLLDYQERAGIERLIMNATNQRNRRRYNDMHDTFDRVIETIADVAGGINVYDITSYTPYPTQLLQYYIQDPEIASMYKLNKDIVYNSQGGHVYEHLFTDFMMEYTHLVELLLDANVNVLIYNGQNDLIVETPGTFKWVEKELRAFKDYAKFKDTLMSPWKVDGKVAGFHKIVGALELRTVNDAGHLVPMDQGKNSLEMVRSFINRSL